MSIRNKLVIYTFISIFITLIIVGVSIDQILSNLYKDNARTELSHSYNNFLHELDAIEHDVLNQTILIAKEQSVIAISNMVNRYQDKSNYQPLVFENDKKKIANYLFKQISLTKVEQAILYDKKGDLLAYAIHNKTLNEAGYSSYKKGKNIFIKSIGSSNQWITGPLPKSIYKKIDLQINKAFFNYSGDMKYHSTKNSFSIENNRVVSRLYPDGKKELLGIIKVNKSLNDNFFKTISENGHARVSLILHSGHTLNSQKNVFSLKNINLNANLHGSNTKTFKLFTGENYYIQPHVWPTEERNNHLLILRSKKDLSSALNKTRLVLVFSFFVVALFAILFGIYWLNKLISTPLNALSTQAKNFSMGQLPEFPLVKGNDEISQLSEVLNEMVSTIKDREKSLLENEAQLKNTQKLAKTGGWKIDHKGNEFYFSDEIFKIIGADKKENTACNEIIMDIIHPNDVKMVEKNFNQTMKNHTPYDLTHRLLLKNGQIRTVHVYSETTFDEKGMPLLTKGTMQDITEQAEKDEQLRRSQKMEAIGKLTGGIAHDFNNMLGVILGFTELLQNQSDISDKYKSYLDQIYSAGSRASDLTYKLLSFSRKESTSASCIDINKVISEEQIMLEKTLTVQIKLILELADNLWPLYLDKGEIEDALLNMSINAMHAMPGGGNLTITTSNSTLSPLDVSNMNIPAGDYVLLSISDTGIGMSNDTIAKIFDPFFTTKDEMGTGLGMSQVYGFVKRSHGEIHIYSEVNHGTRISMYFPRYIEANTASQLTDSESAKIDLKGSGTILIVDDEEALRSLTRVILEENGYKTLTADGAVQAMEILKTEDVDLVLTDIIMPDLNGYELAEKIKQEYPDVKIQLCSGFSDVSNSDKKLYKNKLQKPYSSRDLLTIVKERLAKE